MNILEHNLYHNVKLLIGYTNVCMPSRKAVCTRFMLVFGITQSGCEPTTYHMRGRHANHETIPTRYLYLNYWTYMHDVKKL